MRQQYIGTKIVLAEPMENQHTREPGFWVKYKDGYESWSPEDAFIDAYKLYDSMDIGRAVWCLKHNYPVARGAWAFEDGWFAYLIYQQGYPSGVPCNKNTTSALKLAADTLVAVNPHIQLFTPRGNLLQEYSFTHEDILAEDYCLVEL